MYAVQIRPECVACLVATTMLAPLCAAATDDDEALQKKLANPVSDLVTLPMAIGIAGAGA